MDPDEAELRTESPDAYEAFGAHQRERDSSYECSDFAASADEASSSADKGHGASGNALRRKRPAQRASAVRPFKRQKGVFNAEYLDLLNQDIDDAAQRECWQEEVQLLKSQIGLTHWSAIEKRRFFEAMSRLGKYDLPGIAARIGTKSEVEVQQYITLLQDSIKQRKSKNSRSYLEIAEYPAAVELSPQCCHAQEEAADAISVRQERREEQREQLKWGPNWDITPSLAQTLSRHVENGETLPDEALKFAQLFHLPTWLNLSERVFMNSSIPGNNWSNVDDKQPSIWATTFDDFHSLAVSITRRLVQSTLFISTSRIRAKMEFRPSTRRVVRKRDVEAAVASLSMPHNSFERWRTSARRLRLDVFNEQPDGDDEDDDDNDDDDDDAAAAAAAAATETEEEPMTYDEVEKELSFHPETADEEQSSDQRVWKLAVLSDDASDIPDHDARAISGDDNPRQQHTELDDRDEVDRELGEILCYAAADIRHVRSTKEALLVGIKAERRREAQAERHDQYASYQAETHMWSILQRRPPLELPRVQEPGPVQKSNQGLDRILPWGRNWASRLEYYEKWETLDAGSGKEDEEQDRS
ncbi:hypothetical protein E4U19_003134 [Claviceps sp. Clav32 group G5]|nr:hypothetical protein E4U19_003134 [Claviceps sp. Clav32 group G5]